MPAPTVEPKRLTIPTSAAELEAMLQDPTRMKDLFTTNTDQFGEFISNYAKTVLDKDQSIATQVREETQRVVAGFLKEHRQEDLVRPSLAPGDPLPIPAQRNAIHNPKAMGAKIDNEFKGSADYFKSIWHLSQRDAVAQARISRVRAAFDSTVPSEGGFLIPETLRAELLRVALETALIRPRARVIPMESLRVPFPAIDATSNASSVYGGIVCYWTEEGGALTASQAAFSRIVLEAKKLTAYTEVPNELISDSAISFEAFINQIFPEALGFYEDDAFINGTGVGMPLGMLDAGNTSLVSATAETGQPATTVVWENIVKMFARMLPSSLGRAIWIASIDTFPALATMALSVGTGGSAIWLNNGVSGPPMSILGRPVYFTEKVPTLGTAGDISFVDPGFYLIGDRQVMSATSSPHYKFASDLTAYKIIERVDGQPWIKSPITPKNGGSTLSPFVQIATRS